MDQRILRERRRKKQQQLRRRKMIKLGLYVAGVVLLAVFIIRGVILPITHRFLGTEAVETEAVAPVQAEAARDPNAAVRKPLKSSSDLGKVTMMTPGWHTDEQGKWFQNSDGSYFADGFQSINSVQYYFDEAGYVVTGWVTKGVRDYYFNDDGAYDPTRTRPMLALTFDDGPGQYTDRLLDCLEENGAHATFFMLGELVGSYPDTVRRMAELGCEIGNHSWDHTQQTTIDLDSVVSQFSRTDDALIQACGQAATVFRAPYGSYNQDIIDAVGKPHVMWSLDSLDWSYKDVDLDYQEIMEKGDLSDGTIILMHDIHEPSVECATRIIPELIEQGYKLVTISEMAEAKNVILQHASYSDFWASSLANGLVAGDQGSDIPVAFTVDPFDFSGDTEEETSEET